MDNDVLLIRSYVNKKLKNVASPFKIKEAVATYEDLPLTGNEAGDVRTTIDDGQQYYWDGSSWQEYSAYTTSDITVTYDDGTTAIIHNVER